MTSKKSGKQRREKCDACSKVRQVRTIDMGVDYMEICRACFANLLETSEDWRESGCVWEDLER